MTPRRIWQLAVVALVAAVLPAQAQAGAGKGVGYRLTGQPGSTLDRGFVHLPASSGGSARAEFIAVNSTDRAVSVAFYGADGDTTRATGAVFGATSEHAGGWITPSQRTAVLPPNSELTIGVDVRVPGSATVGDHVGAVIMEQQEGSSSATVKQVVRYAVPLLIDIAGGAGARLELGTARLGRIDGTDIVTAILPMQNTGSRICRPVVSANVAGSGINPINVQRQLDEILPGDRIRYPLRLSDGLSAGTYFVKADVSGCGPTVSTSSSATLESKDTGAAPVPTATTPSVEGETEITPVPLKRKKAKAGSAGKGDRGDTSNRQTDPTRAPDPVADSGDDDQAAAPVVPIKPDKPGWLSRAASAVVDNAPKVLERGAVPLGASALVGLLFLFQNALDRRDPKLAGAPRQRDDALRFDPNPLHS